MSFIDLARRDDVPSSVLRGLRSLTRGDRQCLSGEAGRAPGPAEAGGHFLQSISPWSSFSESLLSYPVWIFLNYSFRTFEGHIILTYQDTVLQNQTTWIIYYSLSPFSDPTTPGVQCQKEKHVQLDCNLFLWSYYQSMLKYIEHFFPLIQCY